jgi:hypothetical protein
MLPTIRILPAAVVSVIAVIIIAAAIAAAGAAAVIPTAVAIVRGTIAGPLRGCARSNEDVLLEAQLARRRGLRPEGKERPASSVTRAGVNERAPRTSSWGFGWTWAKPRADADRERLSDSGPESERHLPSPSPPPLHALSRTHAHCFTSCLLSSISAIMKYARISA